MNNSLRKAQHNDDDQNNSDIACFVQLWKAGVITQDELRRKVLQWTPVSPPPTLPRKRKLPSRVDIDDEIDKNVEAFNPAVALSPTTIPRPLKQKRPGKPTVTVGILRKLAKEPTRRRFFAQCCMIDSVLWYTTLGGTQQMQKMLFVRAAQDPMDIIFRDNPGTTRNVSTALLLKVVKWQVAKDRNNWMGKTPKREMLFGPVLPFDWESELSKLQQLPEENLVRTSSASSSSSFASKASSSSGSDIVPRSITTNSAVPKAPATVPVPFVQEQHNDKPIDVDNLKACQVCAVNVWIGAAEEAPKGTPAACPPGTDWKENAAEAYCKKCWLEEQKQMDEMGAQYRGTGPTKDKQVKAKKDKQAKAKKDEQAKAKKDKQAKAKKDKQAKAKKDKKAKANKKKLGGVQGPLQDTQSTVPAPATEKPLTRWCLGQSVNVKYEDGKYYGAFVSGVNVDNTYTVYFKEDAITMKNVPHADIKLPITKGRTSQHWSDYVGKTFFDKGSSNPYFAPGDFVVKEIDSDNNFSCLRVGEEDCADNRVDFDMGYVIRRVMQYEDDEYTE